MNSCPRVHNHSFLCLPYEVSQAIICEVKVAPSHFAWFAAHLNARHGV